MFNNNNNARISPQVTIYFMSGLLTLMSIFSLIQPQEKVTCQQNPNFTQTGVNYCTNNSDLTSNY